MDWPAADQRIDDLRRHVSISRQGAESAALRTDRALVRLRAIERLMAACASTPAPVRAAATATALAAAPPRDTAPARPPTGGRASLRDGPLAELFRATDDRLPRPPANRDRPA